MFFKIKNCFCKLTDRFFPEINYLVSKIEYNNCYNSLGEQ